MSRAQQFAFSMERVTRRRWLIEQTLLGGVRRGTPRVDIWTAMEAVATTAIEHPEWDMEEVRTRLDWAEMHNEVPSKQR